MPRVGLDEADAPMAATEQVFGEIAACAHVVDRYERLAAILVQRRDGNVLGAIGVERRDFSDRDVALAALKEGP